MGHPYAAPATLGGPIGPVRPLQVNDPKGVSVARTAKRLLFGLDGFTPDLMDAAAARDDVELVDLQRLFDGD